MNHFTVSTQIFNSRGESEKGLSVYKLRSSNPSNCSLDILRKHFINTKGKAIQYIIANVFLFSILASNVIALTF